MRRLETAITPGWMALCNGNYRRRNPLWQVSAHWAQSNASYRLPLLHEGHKVCCPSQVALAGIAATVPCRVTVESPNMNINCEAVRGFRSPVSAGGHLVASSLHPAPYLALNPKLQIPGPYQALVPAPNTPHAKPYTTTSYRKGQGKV